MSIGFYLAHSQFVCLDGNHRLYQHLKDCDNRAASSLRAHLVFPFDRAQKNFLDIYKERAMVIFKNSLNTGTSTFTLLFFAYSISRFPFWTCGNYGGLAILLSRWQRKILRFRAPVEAGAATLFQRKLL